jgi:beta-aspartyl-peptidase (threonine type)
MNFKVVTILFSLFLFSCKTETKKEETVKAIPFALVLHGGAGNITSKNFSTERQKEYQLVLKKALNKGYKVLENGGKSIDAVQQTIAVLENSPLFNAGKGSVFDSEGKNRMDASIMDGKTLNSGAVAGVTNIKNPIFLARVVMDKTKHVLLSGKGAEIFAEQNNISFENDAYFYTKRQADYLKKVQKREREKSLQSISQNNSKLNTQNTIFKKYGTVGCVALDKNGNLSAGTSTGGLTNKKYGRIGDSPLVGAGTYANNKTCGVSCTGVGEYFIRTLAAHEVSSLMRYRKYSAKQAIAEVIHNQINNLGGEGGIIVLDNKGNIAWDFNTKGMFRAYKKSTGEYEIKFFKIEKVIK